MCKAPREKEVQGATEGEGGGARCRGRVQGAEERGARRQGVRGGIGGAGEREEGV